MINESQFPHLAGSGYELTSRSDESYNCIAYAAGVEDEWWDPNGVWPDDVEPNDSVDNLIAVYSRHGFQECPDGAPEAGVEKIAIYGRDGVYEHAARLLPDGRWTNKMGPDEDIAHPDLKALEDGFYGNVLKFMRRAAR